MGRHLDAFRARCKRLGHIHDSEGEVACLASALGTARGQHTRAELERLLEDAIVEDWLSL